MYIKKFSKILLIFLTFIFSFIFFSITNTAIAIIEQHCGKGEEAYPYPLKTKRDKCYFFKSQFEECTAEFELYRDVRAHRRDYLEREIKRVKEEMEYYCNGVED